MVSLTPNPSYSLTIRMHVPNQAGMLARVTRAIAEAGGNLGDIDVIERCRANVTRDVSVDAASAEHAEETLHKASDIHQKSRQKSYIHEHNGIGGDSWRLLQGNH